jgi:hypothetical protein
MTVPLGESFMGKPTSRQAGENASDAHGIKIGIRRLGSGVQMSLHCAGDYQAIELYDRLVESARKGKVTIDLRAR